ncbi:MAG: bifunctional (p)ppGpp synthetase/guanosine-3',5'-bis(diphosphate) 3'-pyrophosphohydrolase [Prevotella sp.]|nr:bifunctional (p)ppGpp synthetase/guanosine-3',5'-bis(diphosphate) 3'-pyrophosphohydrolase [Prevotella sp.]MBQ8058416.1 bifunctional (p)ppGpp synthetase/guanosine-3',5'-bis(diphosphate) 3'-pyrophosphohydrolase [Prevotella sp.]MBQ8116231.1 bifunctional (p)ppGpp synthetase/guanosine-3',5'-bis(diphosphate) 3'-pyrophosphohydrolase [Prevotella sp.]
MIFDSREKDKALSIINSLRIRLNTALLPDDEGRLRRILFTAIREGQIDRDTFGLNPILMSMQTAYIAVNEIGLRRDSVIATLLTPLVLNDSYTLDEAERDFGAGPKNILQGLLHVQELYKKTPVIETENFRNLLLSFAEDMRVILLMIADRVNVMREIRNVTDIESQRRVAEEASYLYAPLAHKLGLYKLKSELEDLSLKYLEHDAYYHIKEKLSATKRARDKYINDFIGPIREKLQAAGLRFHMKGRTKSIHSIWQKMKKQRCPFEGVYDLFAIRIILDSEGEQEKKDCWQVYSIITDMYQPNPKRLRDWLSVPKSNGYESLHITVLGPEQKWVEVQIRTERMDEIAEHGLAAHWRYKGVKAGGGGMEEWLAIVRRALEAGDDMQVMDQFRMDLYEDEVFVFTPKGEIKKFPMGATVLDFAYLIHSRIGNQCVGARINGRNVQIREELHSGDTVEILTSAQQKPKRDWLQIVKTSHAKSKIRQAIKEAQAADGLYAREVLYRRFKNRKIEVDEPLLQQLIKKMGYKEVSDFYIAIANEQLDVLTVIDRYMELKNPQVSAGDDGEGAPRKSASEYVMKERRDDDVLVIDRNLKGVDYTLAKCCNPIYGDDVFGFVTVSGGIRIHRQDCPNAPEMRSRYGYRIVKARWSEKGSGRYDITMQVIGNDDIDIVNNITSVISKEENTALRAINIDSDDGLFKGVITVALDDTSRLEALIRKLQNIKGVKSVKRM